MATEGQFPYTVLILYWNFDNRCTGTLLTTHHIITAAHCPFIPGGPLVQFVMAGDIHKSEYQSNKQQIRIFKRYALHPNYPSARGWMKIQYDIGIILLDIPFILTDHLKPIKFAKEPIPVGTLCVLPGWGFTRYLKVCEQNDILRYHPERIYPKKVCNIKEYTLMCGGKNFGCPGDCGGSVICNNTAQGIYTFAVQINGSLRSLYTDIAPHYSWIRSVIKKKFMKYYIAGKQYSTAVKIFPIFYHFSFYNAFKKMLI
ncbi:unnamed protein product [Hermetia illucens]|uniref:Peptidase S1 domain-containing protein n=2 Tax=Hermetia illucens TaxID=343691 RepID=A0A7R8UR76_HERIL|nr:unnamed protein product [Hermetia illucens]